MKKSELFRQAQISVLRDVLLSNEETLDVIKVLMDREDIEKFIEKREEEKCKENI